MYERHVLSSTINQRGRKRSLLVESVSRQARETTLGLREPARRAIQDLLLAWILRCKQVDKIVARGHRRITREARRVPVCARGHVRARRECTRLHGERSMSGRSGGVLEGAKGRNDPRRPRTGPGEALRNTSENTRGSAGKRSEAAFTRQRPQRNRCRIRSAISVMSCAARFERNTAAQPKAPAVVESVSRVRPPAPYLAFFFSSSRSRAPAALVRSCTSPLGSSLLSPLYRIE